MAVMSNLLIDLERYIQKQTIKDLNTKMVFIAGPRQSGKTTFSSNLLKQMKGQYYNWDDPSDREIILKGKWPSEKNLLLIFDEIHKQRNWKSLIKGLYDKRKNDFKILVTGSAKLDVIRKGGDSLQGRYHLLRLHPLSINEIKDANKSTIYDLMKYGPFPEPFLGQDETEARRWRREYRTRLIRDDIRDLEDIAYLDKLEQLVLRLPELVGSGLSINSLKEDLSLSHETVVRYLNILENIYGIFRIHPFSSSKLNSLKKMAKHYHYDYALIEDEGVKFENMVASHLLKHCHFIEDTEGHDMELCYYRDKEKREVDFVVLKNRRPIIFIEAKKSNHNISPDLLYLKKKFPNVDALQVVLESKEDYTNNDQIRVQNALSFFKSLSC